MLPLPLLPPPSQPLSPALRRILYRVSRSFSLTIRLLPHMLRVPVSVGYLLARATDTVADTTDLPLAQRQQLLNLMSAVIASPDHPTAIQTDLVPLSQDFAAQQANPHERALMRALPQCLALLQGLAPDDLSSVRSVLGHITRGQQLDMARFGPGLHALQSEAELTEYTWLVAGCVGEFWTALCERHLPGYASLPNAEMMRLGRQYGMGLQRLNILRDSGADLAAGRCYWPAESLGSVHLTPHQLADAAKTSHLASMQALAPLHAAWLDHTQQQLADGMTYSLALRPWRLRLASALPALIGARTVALLRQAGPLSLGQQVKMPRHEMRRLLWQLVRGGVSPSALARQFQLLSRPSPS